MMHPYMWRIAWEKLQKYHEYTRNLKSLNKKNEKQTNNHIR